MIQWKISDINQGLALRRAGMTYGGIAIVMREYHGLVGVTECAVRTQLRSYGALPSPRGRVENVIDHRGTRHG